MCCFLVHGICNCLLIIYMFIDIVVLAIFSLGIESDGCPFRYQSRADICGMCWLAPALI